MQVYSIKFFLLAFSGVGTTDSAIGDDGVLDIDVTISNETTWHAMEELVGAGLAKSIGIRFSSLNCACYILILQISRLHLLLQFDGISSVLTMYDGDSL
jgi:hypothetical protein